jgi:uncharacterized membrane protein
MNGIVDGKTVAIVSYITLIGWIIALLLHFNNKTTFGAFHMRQSLGLFLSALVVGWIPGVGWLLSLGVLALWVLGLIAAIQGEQRPIPLLGDFFQNLLGFIR